MKNDVDNKLTDKAWQSMRVLLDRDMPEQRRRRPLAWWWAAALLLLPIAGAGGWWFYRQAEPVKSHSPTVEKPKISEPVAEAETNFPKVDNFRKVEAYSSDDPKSSDESFAPKKVKEKGQTNKYSVSSASLEQPEIERNPPVATAAYADSPAEAPSREATFQKPAFFANFNDLPLVSQLVDNENEHNINLCSVSAVEQTPVKKHTGPKRWSFGLTTGLASEKLNKINGFLAGGTADFQFARKWGLRSGLQYAQYRSSEEERPIVALNDAQYVEATGNFAVLDDNTTTSGPGTGGVVLVQETVLVPVEKFHRLEMPLLVYWNPLRPLRIFGGIAGSYTLSAKASPQNYSNNKFYYADTQTAEENLNELAANALPRWNMDLTFGAGLRFGKHVELDAFFSPGLSKPASDVLQDNQSGFYDPSAGWQQRSVNAQSRFFLQGVFYF